MDNQNAKIAVIKSAAAITLAFIGMFLSLKLKLSNSISEPTSVLFVAFSILVGLFIAYSHKIEKFNLRSLEITLREVKQTEASIKEVGRAMLALVEQSMSQSLVTEAFDQQAFNTSVDNLRKLIN